MKDIPSLPLTEFDIVTCGTYFQLAKAYIPFLPPHKQKDFALLIRMAEFITTLEFYRNAKPEDYPQKSGESPDLSNLFSTFNTVSSFKKNPDELMHNLLTKDQQELFEKYKNMFDI